MDPDRYVARFTEGLALMKALWTEPRVTFDGEFWQLQDAGDGAQAARRSRTRRSGSARNGPAALRRAVRLGDGFFGAGLHADRDVRRAGADRAGGAGRGGPARPGSSASPSGCTSRWTTTRAGPAARINAALERLYGRRSEQIEAAAVAGHAG